MYDLITFKAGFGNVSFSPFCVKAIWMLNHAGGDWQREDSLDPRKYSHGKLPVLRAEGRLIHDSDAIGQFLEAKGADFWGDTSARDKAMGRSLIRMAEDHLYFHVVHDRWLNDDVWPHIKAAYFIGIPALIRGFVTNGLRKNVKLGLAAQGLGRLSSDERLARLDQDLAAIRDILTDTAYLLGASPTLPDFSMASTLANIAASPVATATSRRVQDDPVLMGYIEQMKETYD